MIYSKVNLDGRIVDIEVIDGVITSIESTLSGDEKIDCNGAIVIPGLVDLNVNVYENSLNSKTLKKISQEALRGGVSHIVLNSTSKPAIDNEIVLEFVLKHENIENGAKVQCAFSAINEQNALSNISILQKKGAVAPYITTNISNNTITKIAQYLQMNENILFCRAVDQSLSSSGVMNDGEISSRLGLPGISELSEVLHVTQMIEIAKEFNIKILFKNIASPSSIELIDLAKDAGIQVLCEVSINHLLFCDKMCEDFNTIAKIDPPLPSLKNQQKLLELLANGSIDILTSAHTPFSAINKEVAFFDASYGAESIQDIVAIYYTKLVKTGIISLQRLFELTIFNPLRVINQTFCEIKAGNRANFSLLDINESYTITNSHSLFYNEKMDAKLLTVT